MSPRLAFAARALALSLLLTPVTAAAQGAPGTDAKAATAHFERGVTFYKAKQFADALAEFRASYAAVPSPNSHLYVARCLAASGDVAAAFSEFDAVVAEAETRALGEPKYAPTRDTARLERDELGEKIALVTFVVPGADPAATLEVGGRPVARERWSTPTPVKPGATEIVLRGATGTIATLSITFTPGEKRAVTVEAPAAGPATPAPATVAPAPARHDGSSRAWMRPAAYVAGGVGVAGLVMFAVGGAMANSTYATLQAECVGPCPQERAGDVSAGKTQQTVANVGLALGVIGVASGVTLFLLAPRAGHDAAATSELVVGPGWSGLRGRF
jgi:hypothetical protein